MIRFFGLSLILIFFLMVLSVGGGVLIFYKYGQDLPAYGQLADYDPQLEFMQVMGDF